MKHRVAITTIAIFSAWVVSAFSAVDWEHDYAAGLQRAKRDKKLVMIDLYTDWCGWCKKLDKDTYGNKEVGEKVAKDFVAVKLNPEKSPDGAALVRQFGVIGYPHVLFVDPTGAKVSEIAEYEPPAEFLKHLQMIIDKAAKK